MTIGLGSDICNIRRVEKAYERFGGRFLARCFGAEERRELDAIGGDKARFTASLAKRFAAKEAFVKALGTGFAHGIAWAEIEVVHLPGGRPAFRVSGQAEAVLRKIIPASRLWLSLSDDYPLAQAVVIIESC